MSYIRKGMSGVSSQPPGRRVLSHNVRAFGGVASQPRGRRIARRALGGSVVEYPISQVAIDIISKPLPPPPPPKPPPQQRVISRRLSLANRLGLGGTLGDTAPATVIDPETRTYQQRALELQSQMVSAQQHWAEGDKTQKWIQIAATIMIPVTAAIWRAIGVGRKRSPT